MAGTASLIEILWTISGVVTLIFCGRSLRRATIARAAIEQRDLNAREKRALLLFTRLRIGIEVLFCYIQVGFIAIGLYAMFQPPANPNPDDHQWGSILATVVFLTIQAGCLYVSVWADRLRGKVISMEEQRLLDEYQGEERRLAQIPVFGSDRRRKDDHGGM